MQPTEPTQLPQTGGDKPMPIASKKLWLLVLVVVAVVGGIVAYVLLTSNRSQQADVSEEDVPIISSIASVSINANGLSPATIKLKKGQQVTWINETAAAHRLTADQEELPGFDTVEALGQGDTYTYIFETAGTFRYYDPENPQGYTGTVTVE